MARCSWQAACTGYDFLQRQLKSSRRMTRCRLHTSSVSHVLPMPGSPYARCLVKETTQRASASAAARTHDEQFRVTGDGKAFAAGDGERDGGAEEDAGEHRSRVTHAERCSERRHRNLAREKTTRRVGPQALSAFPI